MSAPPLLSVTWSDRVTGRLGCLVVGRPVRGVAGGGLRLREGRTVDEVACLARGTTPRATAQAPAEERLP